MENVIFGIFPNTLGLRPFFDVIGYLYEYQFGWTKDFSVSWNKRLIAWIIIAAETKKSKYVKK